MLLLQMAAFQLSKLSNDVVPMLNEGKVLLGFLLRPFVRMVCGIGASQSLSRRFPLR
jgi:hypothetical protein